MSISKERDIYYWLKRPQGVEERGFCSCQNKILMIGADFHGYPNPFSCGSCGSLVDPFDVGLPESLVDICMEWKLALSAIKTLYLRSESYKDWGVAQLGEINSSINREGLELRELLEKELPRQPNIYYWLTKELDSINASCPNCKNILNKNSEEIFLECRECRIFLADPCEDKRVLGH